MILDEITVARAPLEQSCRQAPCSIINDREAEIAVLFSWRDSALPPRR